MNKTLISATLIKTADIATLEQLRNKFGYGIISANIHCGVGIYKITYATTFIGRQIKASGLLLLPTDLTHPLPVLSIHNGTTFLKSEAPSVWIEEEYTGFEFFAASGYITIIPDYIGYGESSEEYHPYYDADSSATCVIDMLIAVQEYLISHGIPFTKKLFLTGYSEGGYITLATLRKLEQHNATTFEIAAVAAGAGGFDLFSMLAALSTGHTKHIQPAYIAYLIMAYIKVYQWNKPLSYYFKEPYASLIPELFWGKHDKQYINDRLGSDLGKLFNPLFYSNLTGAGEMELKKALLANSLSNWRPVANLNLYHATADEVIPYENTAYTYQRFLFNGAKNTQFFPLASTTHNSSLIPMLEHVKPWFDSLK